MQQFGEGLDEQEHLQVRQLDPGSHRKLLGELFFFAKARNGATTPTQRGRGSAPVMSGKRHRWSSLPMTQAKKHLLGKLVERHLPNRYAMHKDRRHLVLLHGIDIYSICYSLQVRLIPTFLGK